ncbi:MAG: DUF5706 domain-containing protein [Saprospiraceae bacterium]|nr:DUF5706 domain-containing protein [Saprospiraceae bacterium]
MQDQPQKTSTTPEQPGILAQAHAFILQRFNQQDDTRLVYHNYLQTTEIVNNAKLILANTKISSANQTDVLLAAWFLQSGFLMDYEQPAPQSIRLCRQFLQSRQHAPNRIEQITDAIQTVLREAPCVSSLSKILSDAYNITHFLSEFDLRSPLRHLEWELINNQRFSKQEWAQLQLQRLMNVRFYTHAAKTKHEQKLAQQILDLRQQVAKLDNNQTFEEDSEDKRLYRDLEKKLPVRAVQTFFRANYRNHINLSAIADNKANIMISVNTILISVLITFLSYRNIGETQPRVLLPVVIFLVTGLASLIFAVLSARPKVTSLNNAQTDRTELQKNIIFFGNFTQVKLDQFEEAMDAVFRDSELMYGNMTRDLYYLGKVLEKKYKFLSISYNIFMVGFIFTVMTFLFALFY